MLYEPLFLVAQSIAQQSFSLQNFIQWVIAGLISAITVVLGIKHGLKDLQDKFDKLDRDVEKGFSDLKHELDKVKETQNSVSERVRLLEYRADQVTPTPKKQPRRS